MRPQLALGILTAAQVYQEALAVVVSMDDIDISASSDDDVAARAEANINLYDTGLIEKDQVQNGSSTVISDPWSTPFPLDDRLGGYFEARLTKSGGADPDAGALNEWIRIDEITWSWVETATGSSKSFSGTLEIGRVGQSSAEGSCSVSIFVELTP